MAPGPVNISVSPVPLLRDSRGSSSGLSGLLGHSFVIMTFDLCRSVCWEECRRCLPSLRLMVSRWLFLFTFFNLVCFYQARHLGSSTALVQPVRLVNYAEVVWEYSPSCCWYANTFYYQCLPRKVSLVSALARLWTDFSHLRQRVSELFWLESDERESYWLALCLGPVREHAHPKCHFPEFVSHQTVSRAVWLDREGIQ